MGTFDRMRDKSSQEQGIEFIGSNNDCFACFALDSSGNGVSITKDIEILRGELAGILLDVTKDDVSYIFDDTIESMEENDKEVRVSFANGTPKTAFDLIVAADGIGSKTRDIAFGAGGSHIKSLNCYVSYFSIPRIDTDTMWSRGHWVKGGRHMVLRPDNVGRTRAFLVLAAYDKSDERLIRFEKVSKEGIPAQKALVQELFHDADWETSRILMGMHDSDDFYMQHVAQVRMNRWSSGRATVVGDAGYACSPFAGMGTSMAFIGAYVLAGEISRQRNKIPAALESYERVLRPYFEGIQKLPPGVPWIAVPQSTLAIRVVETVIWAVGLLSATGLLNLFGKVAAYLPIGGNSFKLPEYEAFKE